MKKTVEDMVVALIDLISVMGLALFMFLSLILFVIFASILGAVCWHYIYTIFTDFPFKWMLLGYIK